jgi:hypothetical protein
MIETMTVTVPEGVSGDVAIRRLTADPPSLRDLIREPGRAIPEGYQFTALYRTGELWMSDTPAERQDHYPALLKAYQLAARRVLVNGLGLGMIVQGLLQVASVEHIDVVEIDPDVIALVGDHYRQQATAMGKTVEIHQGDAYTIRWPRGTCWDIAWSDIWPTATIVNLPDMDRLSRRYGTRVRWHGHWLRETLLALRREDRRLQRQRAVLLANR